MMNHSTESTEVGILHQGSEGSEEGNMEITTSQLQILRHSLGLNHEGRGRMYRDYYCAEVGGSSDIQKLVSLGLMVAGRIINDGRDQYFIVTDAGRAEAVKNVPPLPKLTKSQRVYRAYLRSETSLSFGDFLKSEYYADMRRRA